MKISFNTQTEAKQDECTIVVIGKNEDISRSGLRQKDELFFQQELMKNKSLIELNDYGRLTVVAKIPEGTEHWQINERLRRKGYSIFRTLEKYQVKKVGIVAFDVEMAYLLLEGLYLSSYQFNKYFKKPTKQYLEEIILRFNADAAIVTSLINEAKAVFNARNYVNEPVITLTAPVFAEQIKKDCEETGCTVSIYGKEWIEKENMNGLLAVNKGSVDPPRFTIIEWKPADAVNSQPIVLVGKGIVFDTGGLSLKTSSYMETMKADMGGAAGVVGAMQAIAKNKLKKHVVALIPSTDNRPGGNAYVPGDVIKMRNGIFVEVLNTDAEGRMILADALDYAKKYKPSLVIDMATLTGAANMALAEHAVVALGTAKDHYFHLMEKIGLDVCERIVRFPFWDDYNDFIKSDIADIKNVGGPTAGSITAGKFLAHFIDYPWMHLDISGSAFVKKTLNYKGKGGTGFGVRLLYNFIKELDVS